MLLRATGCLWGQTDRPAPRGRAQPGLTRRPDDLGRRLAAPEPAEPERQIKTAEIELAVESSSDVWDVGLVESLFYNIKWREYLGKKGLKIPSEDTCEIQARVYGDYNHPSPAHSYLDPTRKTWRFSVSVYAIGRPDAVKACDVEQAAKLLTEKLKNDIHDAYSLRLKVLNEEREKLQGMTINSRNRLEELLHEGESKGLFPENFELIIKRGARLESKQEDLRVALTGKRARKKALAKEIARLSAVTKEKTAADPVTRELERIVGLQAEQLQKVREARAREAATDSEIRQAEIKLAESRIRLAERREKIGQKQGNGRLGKLNVELAELGTDIVEIEAQLEETQRRLEVLARKRTEIRSAGSSLHLRIAEAEANLKELTQRLGKLEAILHRAGEAHVSLGNPEVRTEPFYDRSRVARTRRGMMRPDMMGPPRGRSGDVRGRPMRPDMMMSPPRRPRRPGGRSRRTAPTRR